MATQLDHLILLVNDRARSVEFYTRMLGFVAEGTREPFAVVRVNAELTLQIAAWGTQGGTHLAFAMPRSEFDTVFARVREAGIPFGDAFNAVGNMRGPGDEAGARGPGKALYFFDPDQHLIEARFYEAAAIEFNHAMIYTADLPRALKFYSDGLGFAEIESYPGGAYVRLKSPSGDTTIALHKLETGQRIDAATEGLRLYFEIEELDAFCAALAKKGVTFKQMPTDMPWGWRHAYLHDPDGHEISLYWAGSGRFKKTAM